MTDDPAGAYPQHWEADVLLADGGAVHIRPAAPTDGPAIMAMHERMSDRTRYLRYFQAVSRISPAQLAVYTDVDHVSSVGLVAELGGQLIAAGSYHRDPTRPDTAEVAFVVEDAHQRRGLGSILLEHLAAAAQERGIKRFTAEVLGENQTMLRVFIDAGYAVTREFSSGVVDLAFDIKPTESSLAVITSREFRAESRSIARLLAPRSVAVIGASNETRKLGHAVLVNLLRAGFTGPVYPVNPETLSVQGVRAYKSVLDIPDPVDIAVVTVPAASVAQVLESCRIKGVHGLVVVTGGFADADADTDLAGDGAAAQRRMVALARANGMRVVGPNCLGLVNTDPGVRLNATLAPVVPPPGRVGFFCQSGALGIAILADAASRGLGLSSFVSAGNRADVSGNDLLQFWHSDDRTEVVLLYLESFGNPRKFARLARTLARDKPVIAVKSGRHALVSPGLAASSAAVSDTAVATLFAQSGVIRTDTLGEAFDAAQLLAHQPIPAGNRVAILGNSSALGVLALDACIEAGLVVVDEVPVDFGVNVSPGDLGAAVRVAVGRVDVDAVVVVYVPPVAIPGQAHAEALKEAARGARVPVVTTFLAVDGLAEALTVPGEDGGAARGSVPSYRTPERAVAALAHAVRYGAWRSRPAGSIPELDGVDAGRARELVTALRAKDPRDRALTDAELVELLDCYGIGILPFETADTAADVVAAAERIGYPVALKAYDLTWRHRYDQLGVRLSLGDADQVAVAYDDLADAGMPQVYIQAMAPRERGVLPTVLAVTSDPSFGALVSFGIGGVATELLHDLAYQAVPLTDVDAEDLIKAPKAAPLLTGYRGGPVVDQAAVVDLALRLSALADDLPEISELLLEPVLLGPAGASVTGATGRIGPPGVRPDVRRRLR
ncbi:bifunctional acetate--CoA ligase family protein/GNAT family N-acetyltransferase [Nakamurella panacisegetis]|uniref:bifunctional acetate--CoA ligase family protein/GNAT family N-acetyltransferase n=1 Tax=Nakamurella panacisegetis TaxID=1090615 RepID=UPI000B1C19E3|nr:bifunctional GNAT family N-acetyltransferase/acetate--CoA ligase family protein [Nakamurella panacisegetis]